MIRIKPVLRLFLVSICVLVLIRLLSCKGTPISIPEPEVPSFLEPVFSISSITVLQAELINTRLKVQVRVDNPNVYSVDLTSFEYKLYGAGRFWADGKETKILTVPASSFGEKELYLVMNFTNMHRDMLDQIIAMKKVRYRFTGTAIIKTAVEYIPVYTKYFNLEGESEVER
ncbi:MAG: LEA type 2 family protein [Spirochaetaceae bacterium]|jgi:LEA14-like dessication related protein|nr:LEA type 2 family protein [Spirochaetaceae bacterium]